MFIRILQKQMDEEKFTLGLNYLIEISYYWTALQVKMFHHIFLKIQI